jgi:hypothetical protein
MNRLEVEWLSRYWEVSAPSRKTKTGRWRDRKARGTRRQRVYSRVSGHFLIAGAGIDSDRLGKHLLLSTL